MINVDPPTGNFPASGGRSTHNIVSESDSRLAFKLLTNDHYLFIDSAYGFIEAKGTASLDIYCISGPAREDVFVIQFAEVSADETDPTAPFKAEAQQGEVTVNYTAA